ncbi:single-stranded DNA-binding protein [Corynebacterium lizhenjunii]|uniref:Single-stranded DNA-binding protein n=1 Tax=Corynebacterium lizhenjunii TaxID=2709394 RepID=A0A7T0KD10_9CORY|nr:single-stranded DNA-binding protein [Corynebacterium lizhenjunii]QPK78292.1 single-stranded DNA-binding protein [Corynebacterium lizhenjunii]
MANHVVISGNLTEDPVLRYTSDGTPLVSFTVAHNQSQWDASTNSWVQDQDGAVFVPVTLWRKKAQNFVEAMRGGRRPVMVSGKLVLDRWQDKATGAKRSRLRIEAVDVAVLPAAASGGSQSVGSQSDGGGGSDSGGWGEPAPVGGQSGVGGFGQGSEQPPF